MMEERENIKKKKKKGYLELVGTIEGRKSTIPGSEGGSSFNRLDRGHNGWSRRRRRPEGSKAATEEQGMVARGLASGCSNQERGGEEGLGKGEGRERDDTEREREKRGKYGGCVAL